MSTEKNSRNPKKSRALLIGGVTLAALAGGLFASTFDNGSTQQVAGEAQPGKYMYEVGTPGPGETAPTFYRQTADGANFNLADYRGKTVMLYFHEGGGCQPCWEQITDIENNWAQFETAGIDAFASITTDPINALKRKVELEGIETPAMTDPGLQVSQTYTTNKYGMMGDGYNGHSFIVVGPDGTIQWRADYGGAPQYNMYIPVPNILADMKHDVQTTQAVAR